jgi:hypothetical protein
MVDVAQSAEHRVVAPAVAGSSPVVHPKEIKGLGITSLTPLFISNRISNLDIKKSLFRLGIVGLYKQTKRPLNHISFFLSRQCWFGEKRK